MSSFEERKDAFENKFAHDAELTFKVEARCCKLFGIWAAEQLGLTGADAETYAKEVIGANLEEPGFDDVKRKVIPDFQAKSLDISEHIIDSMLEKYFEEAKIQIMSATES
ncbi:MAG: DUF1476 domain-containing protein [Alphaproteobacteria bacterium CG_4_9_14_3_um_filter_47_13]|nr:MAG: DUF1476 domain-containing protein [Alphaproteobacteria bacterium CG_4_9_14_3_um_filter_47_13]